MTLLIISPDYASHLLPLATLGTAWRDEGQEVVVATGGATAPIVSEFGYRRVDLPLGRGANAGVIRAQEQRSDEAGSLERFFAATREGMLPTLAHQARERLTDLMWQPVDRAGRTLEVVDRVEPDAVLVDHLAFSARLALHTAGIPYADVVLGHPSALPAPGEVYGLPPAWPAAFRPDPAGLAELESLCREVSRRFTAQWNAAARELDGHAAPVPDAFALHGDTVLFNYPRELAVGDGRPLPRHVFLGSTRRTERPDDEVDRWMARDEPYVYVSLGSFLSVRADVLTTVAAGLRRAGIRAAIATGVTPPAALDDVPASWLVRDYLPQVRLLGGARAAISHGGNNSVTEAVGQGVPLVVLPFSTDQFAGAAALERRGMGVALDPNRARAQDITAALGRVLDLPAGARRRLDAVAADDRARPGPAIAYETLGADVDIHSPE